MDHIFQYITNFPFLKYSMSKKKKKKKEKYSLCLTVYYPSLHEILLSLERKFFENSTENYNLSMGNCI